MSPERAVKVMGVVNITPDSFSDGGRYNRPEEAVRRIRNFIEEGADIIDLGAESTRPGATPITWEEEWSRLEPVLAALDPRSVGGTRSPAFSVDTYHPETAERAVAAGVTIVNCVLREPVPAMAAICERTGAELVLPWRVGWTEGEAGYTPDSLRARGIRLWLDPMIGFDTTRDEDLALLRSVPELARQGDVLVGASRKRIVKKLTGCKVTGKNLGGNLAIAVWAALNGAACVRVHDVAETVQAVKTAAAIAAPL